MTETDALFPLIDRLLALPVLTVETCANALGVELAPLSNNPYFSFFESAGIDLGAVKAVADVRISKLSPQTRGQVTLSLSGACIGLEAIRARYGALEILDLPRGRSLDEEKSYSTRIDGRRLSFGFAERKPACLASVTVLRGE